MSTSTDTTTGATPEAPDATGSTATTATDATTANTTSDGGKQDNLGDAGKKALDEERRARRAAEKELAELRKATMTEQEKAVDAARTEAKAEALKQFGGRLVDAELKAALAGRTLTPDALLTFDRAAFLTEDGQVDAAAISTWVAKHSTEPAPQRPPSFDGGVRTTSDAKGPAADFARHIQSQLGR